MATGTVVGFAAGVAMRSRWAMLLTPVVHVAAFELGRVGVEGPTVEGLHFDTSYGILAFVLGRGFYGLVGVVPMVVFAAWGAGLMRRRSHVAPAGRRAARYGRRIITALATAGLLALAVLIAQPASTPPIVGANGKPLPGSIATLQQVHLGGHDQWLEIRGYNVHNPVLLYLSGGPGQSDLPFSRVFFGGLTKHFTVVGWDQRGTGKSYPSLDPSTYTLDGAVADTIQLTNYLRHRFGQRKVYLIGESWGTILGVLAVQRHPELYRAYIASGQMVDPRRTDQQLYRDVLALAARTRDTGLAEEMRSYGPPPYDSVWAYGLVMSQYDKLAGNFTKPKAYEDLGSTSGIGPWGVMGSEYNLVDKVNLLRGLLDTYAVLYPQLQQIDFRTTAERLDVPVYMLDGRHELAARRTLALDWYTHLRAPRKHIYTFADADHSATFEEFQALEHIMIHTVLPETHKQSTPRVAR
ncbi:MAG TPA: alpha/beta hydrolase [Solirubrobacteraceae bacterium]|nr:alpha/beta hydrolase [Solirubrobacteraceae bacterium]